MQFALSNYAILPVQNNLANCSNYPNLSVQNNRIMDSSNLIGNRYRMSDDLIGEGGYGKVYIGEDIATGEKVAIKVTELHPRTGLVAILELSILSSFSYCFLNSARYICTDDKYTYIVQDLALRDLRREIKKSPPDFEKAKKWCYQICKGLCSLHEQGIIHCDIKPANVLLFQDGNIKLNDFTLALIKYNPNDTFCRDTCTINYRPPESFMGEQWDESLDIWSLGCTFYEICTGKRLIPSQEILFNKSISASEEQLRQLSSMATLRSILDWRSRIGDYTKSSSYFPSITSEFSAVELSQEWSNIPSSFQDLIISMTSFNPKLRPRISEIIRHPIFADVSGPSRVLVREIHPRCISDSVSNYIERHVTKINRDQLVLKVTKDLYCRIVDCFNDHSAAAVFLRIETCIWLAEKLIYIRPKSKLYSNLMDILSMEKIICEKLRYNLHFHPPAKLFVRGRELWN